LSKNAGDYVSLKITNSSDSKGLQIQPNQQGPKIKNGAQFQINKVVLLKLAPDLKKLSRLNRQSLQRGVPEEAPEPERGGGTNSAKEPQRSRANSPKLIEPETNPIIGQSLQIQDFNYIEVFGQMVCPKTLQEPIR